MRTEAVDHPVVFEVQGLTGHVLTQEAARQHAERFSELASSIEVDITPEMIRSPVSLITGERMHAKFVHSIWLANRDGWPVALLGGHEEAPSDRFPMPTMMVAVLAVDPDLQRRGVAHELAIRTMARSLGLGWVELDVPPDTPITLACQVKDVPERRWLIELYERDFGFERFGTGEHAGDRLVQLIRRI